MDEDGFDPLFNEYTGEYWDDLEPDEDFVSDEDIFPPAVDDEDDFEDFGDDSDDFLE